MRSASGHSIRNTRVGVIGRHLGGGGQLRKHGGTRRLGRRGETVPLTDYQASLARLLSENRTFDSYLAGGAAILIEPNTMRLQPRSRLLPRLRGPGRGSVLLLTGGLLEAAGYSIDVDLNQPGFVRAIVRKEEHAAKVDWARDSDWRFMPTVRDDRVGFVLHPVDLAVNKVLALAGRDEPRDVLDALYLHRQRARARRTVLGGLWQGPWFHSAVSLGIAEKARSDPR